jgi:hypothetical protein
MFPKPEPHRARPDKERGNPKNESQPFVAPIVKPLRPDEPGTIERKAKLSRIKKGRNLLWLAWMPFTAGAVISVLLLIQKQVVSPTSLTPSPTPNAPVISSSTPTPQIATIENPFINSLGMRFVPVNVGNNVLLFCIHQTRRIDYQAVMGELPRPVSSGLAPSDITGDAPVVDVTQWEASQFCQRLNQREARDWTYRLPTMEEWDRAFGDRHVPWPPKNNDNPMGNYLDRTGINFLQGSDPRQSNRWGDLTPIPAMMTISRQQHLSCILKTKMRLAFMIWARMSTSGAAIPDS